MKPHLTDGEAVIWRDMFDLWRKQYDVWPYESHQAFYNLIARTFPAPKRYDRDRVIDALTLALSAKGAPIQVWELGGWDGACAEEMIAACGDGIKEWANIEICPSIAKGTPNTPIYYAYSLRKWVWAYPLPGSYDIAILSHVIEHLSWTHLQKLFRTLRDVPLLYIQTPAAMGEDSHPTGWYGTMSTHKLEVGWRKLDDFLARLGYTYAWRKGECRLLGKRAAPYD